nr:unnamed protein product [Callosobruchus chinensis]
MNNSEVPKERRGGDRIGDGNKEKKNEIKKFIESLSCVESHYCRIVNGRSGGKLDSSRVFSYLWLETDAPKDSNSIASAVYHCLKNFHFKGSIQTVRLFADGCGGQNKTAQ